MDNWIVIVIVIVLVLVCYVTGAFTSRVAREKGYSDKWFWGGFLFGLVALIAACGLPDRATRNELPTQREQAAELPAQRYDEEVDRPIDGLLSDLKALLDKLMEWFWRR